MTALKSHPAKLATPVKDTIILKILAEDSQRGSWLAWSELCIHFQAHHQVQEDEVFLYSKPGLYVHPHVLGRFYELKELVLLKHMK